MTLRAALIGCGKIGSEFADDPLITDVYTHAGAWRACPGVELVAVCDADPEKARRCAQRWQVAHGFTQVEEMLRIIQPDLVSICTPDATHGAMLETALTVPGLRGILAEKPLATSIPVAQTLVDRAQAQGVVLAVNYSRRYAQGHIALAQRIENDLIGNIHQVTGVYTKGTRHNGTHWFDWARMFLGDIVTARGFDTLQEAGDDPTLDARLTFRCGTSGTLAAMNHHNYSVFELELLGSQGRLRIEDSGHRYRLELAKASPHYSGYRSLATVEEGALDMRDTLLHAAHDLLKAVSTGTRPRCTGEDGLKTLAVAEAVRLSATQASTLITL